MFTSEYIDFAYNVFCTRGPRWPCIAHLITRQVESTGLSVQEKKFNTCIDFQDGGHLGFPIRTISATFDLQIALLVQEKKFKIQLLFNMAARATILDFGSE